MIYQDALYNSFLNPSTFNVPGCERLLLCEAKDILSYKITNRQIKSMTTNEPFAILENLEGLQFSVKTEPTKSGTLYEVTVSFTVQVLRADATYFLEELMNSEYSAIAEDENGRFWLLGYREGLRATYEMLNEEGIYAVKMSTKQRLKVEEVAVSVVQGLDLYDYYDSTTPNPIYSTDVLPVRNSPGTVFPSGNVFEVAVVGSGRHIISDTQHHVIVTGGSTLLLSESPTPGQQHVFTATHDAEEAPVEIEPAVGHTIGGVERAKINTKNGSITINFHEGDWIPTGVFR